MVTGLVSKVELSWDHVAAGDFPPTPKQLFTQAVLEQAALAKAAMPHANGRIERARDLVLGGLVTPQANYSFQVRSETAKGKTYVVTPEGCECPDSAKVEGGRCKHRLATWIWRKARKAVEAQAAQGYEAAPAEDLEEPQAPPAPLASPAPVAPASPPVPEASAPALSLPAWALVELHGKHFVTFGGLLAMAHDRGLQSLKAELVTVTSELAIAHAVATFQDGRTFEESADATPKNVNRQVALHFPRCALTRAKGRVLRDALNIPYVCVEELEA
jgi:hypothetical protein